MGVLIAYLLGLLTAVRDKNDSRKNSTQETAANQCKPVPNVPIPIVSIPPAPTDQERANKKKEERRKTVKFWAEIAGIIVLAVYTAFTAAMYFATKKSADAAKTAGEIAEFSQRPWIKIVDVKAKGNAAIPTLTFQGFGYGFFPNGRKQVTFQLGVSSKNIGHSVADASVDYELFLALWENTGPTSHGYSTGYAGEVAKEQKRYCVLSAQRANFDNMRTVFPDEPLDWNGSVSQPILPDRVNHIRQNTEAEYILPVLIVCVNYRWPGSTKIYQSSVLYEAFKSEDRSRFFVTGRDVPEDRILLMRNPSEDHAQ